MLKKVLFLSFILLIFIFCPYKGELKAQRVSDDTQVTGLVISEDGDALSGVSVRIKGKNLGTTTDENGRYILIVPNPESAVLVYSTIGFEPQEIEVNDRNVIDVTLKSESQELGEVVVTAFGQKQLKESVVGAVTSVNPSDLKVPSSNLTTALAGRVSGMIAYQRSGEPGADNAEFFIRGVTTFGYKKDPLILVDGIELSAQDLARLQTDDINDFSILKDATATALYGARAANGVVLITTKEGTVDRKPQVTVRMENSVSAPTKNIKLSDGITYMQMFNESVADFNPLSELPYSKNKIDNTIAGLNDYVYPNTNWRKELFKDYTMNQRFNFNVKGGGKVAQYYLAGTFNQDNGVLKVDKRNNFNNNINLKSYLLRSNININVTSTTEVGIKLYGAFDDYQGPIDNGTTLYNKVMRTDPTLFPAYFEPDESTAFADHILFGNYEDGQYLNPYADLVKGYRTNDNTLMLAQAELRQNLAFITEGLSFRALFNTTRRANYSISRFYAPFFYQVRSYDRMKDVYALDIINEEGGSDVLSYSEAPKEILNTTHIESALNYTKDFDKSKIDIMTVLQLNNRINANAGSLQLSLPHRDIGVSGRFAYSFDRRYFAEFDFGYTGSERFYRNKKFGFFPSYGLAWVVSNEKFWDPIKHIFTKFKVRATYGLVGNDEIGSPTERFFYLSEIDPNASARSAVFGYDAGYRQDGYEISRYPNFDITWEVARQTNIGFELDFSDKLQLVAEFYNQNRSNILMTRAFIPTFVGLSQTPKANVGAARSSGVDLSLNYNQTINKDLWIQAMGNFTYAKSKFTRYEEPEYDKEWYLSRVGYPLSQVWGYIAESLFIDEKEVQNSPVQSFGDYGAGDIKYRDVNGDGLITELDQVPIGYPETPEIVYGFGFSLGYKAFDLSVFLQGLARESFWVSVANTAPFVDTHGGGGSSRNALLKAYEEDHWTYENQDPFALWPKISPTIDALENSRQKSTWFMRNGAFLRLKTVELGYSLPRSRVSRIGLENVRFYLSGNNLLNFSKFKMWDVEMAGNGLGYPTQRVSNVGVLVTF